MTLPHDDPQALAKAAVDLLKRSKHMTIATADSSGQPWAVPVGLKLTEDGGITWFSSITTRHSQNLAANSKMSASMYELADHGEVSLFLEGTGTILEEKDNGYAVYKLSIAGAWMNDDTHTKYDVDYRLLAKELDTTYQ